MTLWINLEFPSNFFIFFNFYSFDNLNSTFHNFIPFPFWIPAHYFCFFVKVFTMMRTIGRATSSSSSSAIVVRVERRLTARQHQHVEPVLLAEGAGVSTLARMSASGVTPFPTWGPTRWNRSGSAGCSAWSRLATDAGALGLQRRQAVGVGLGHLAWKPLSARWCACRVGARHFLR